MQISLMTIVFVILYLMIVGFLAYKGFRGTKTASDYLVAGRKTHPFIMALSYGATFISTSAIVGFLVTAFWLILVKAQEATAIGLVQKVTNGKSSILADSPNWPVVDPLLVALPIALITAILVSLLTKPPSDEHIERCFGK